MSTWSGTARRFARPSCPSGTAQPWGSPRPPRGTVGSPRPAHLGGTARPSVRPTGTAPAGRPRLPRPPAHLPPAPTAIVPLRRSSPWHPADTRLVRSEAAAPASRQHGAAERCLIWLDHAARCATKPQVSDSVGAVPAGLKGITISLIWGYPLNRTCPGQAALHGRLAAGRSRLGGCPQPALPAGGCCLGFGSMMRSR